MIIPEIYRRHLEEFQSLWEHRYELLLASDLTIGDLESWDTRIRDHLDGLLAPGRSMLEMLRTLISEGDTEVEFAAAFVLLRVDAERAAEVVMDALFRAEGDEIKKLERALCCSSLCGLEQRLVEIVVAAAPSNAVAAAVVLAVHGHLDPHLSRLKQLFVDEDPSVRQQAWRLASIQDTQINST